MTCNPYLVLGVSQKATGHEIRAAYRTLALRLHPDAGSLDGAAFIEVRQAYELLRNPALRRDWDEANAPGSEPAPVSYAGAQQARPVAPDLAIAPSARRGLLETVLEALDLVAAGATPTRTAHLQPLLLELVLTQDEAARGGRFAFTIPLQGHDGEMVHLELHLLIPSGAHDGQSAMLQLDHLARRPGPRITVTLRIE